MNKEEKLTLERLKEILRYEPSTGDWYWVLGGKGKSLGKPVGTKAHRGYHVLGIDGTTFLSHRLAWFYMTGSWPKEGIGWKDNNVTNNAWDNLYHRTLEDIRHQRIASFKQTQEDIRRIVVRDVVKKKASFNEEEYQKALEVYVRTEHTETPVYQDDVSEPETEDHSRGPIEGYPPDPSNS